jgi:hypothetical protein
MANWKPKINLENILEKHGVFNEDNFLVDEEEDEDVEDPEDTEDINFEAEAKQLSRSEPPYVKIPARPKKNREVRVFTSNLAEENVDDSD